MPTVRDEEFGDIKITRNAKASHIRVKVGMDGVLRASMPMYAPTLLLKHMLRSSRNEIRSMLEAHHSATIFTSDTPIGKSHGIIVRPSGGSLPRVSRHGQQIIVSLPEGWEVEESQVQALIRPAVIDALRKEAKSYLPRRLSYLAKQNGFFYQRVRFSHASGRWGSCSSTGTISLNIALMKLPFPLIDYVLLHELAHTEEMNHSSTFWAVVERCEPNHKRLRRELKTHTPSV